MGGSKYYEYKGNLYTISQLCELSGLTDAVIRRRMKCGWSIEDCVELPFEEKNTRLSPEWRGKELIVTFPEPLNSVNRQMQPVLNREYRAVPKSLSAIGANTRDYYLITLDNGKPLIVYPNEFTVVREAD